jgi:hypothetical protein
VRLRLPFDGQYEITTPYGEDGHMAIDYACPEGTPMYACMSGKLSHESTIGGGTVARITAETTVSRYCHLSAYVVGDGVQVQAGDPIALSGNTGTLTSGPHLHWSLAINGVAVNPMEYLQEGTMSKVALHFQQMTSWAGPVVAQYWQFPRWVKAMNPLVPDAFPGAYVLGRAYLRADNNAWESACVAKGTAGGAEYFNGLLPYYAERRGIVTAWEAVNEPNLSDTSAAAKYRDFLEEWSRLMHSVGLKCCGGSIAVGNPKLSCFDANNDVLRIIAPALSRCDYWSYHGYWQRPYDPKDNWWAHRYREIVGEAKGMGFTLPPLIISECGADIGGGHNDGWRVQYNNDWNAYFADIKRYSGELNKDAYVVAATFFTSGPNGDWDMFEVDQANAIALGQFVVGDVPVDPPVPVDDLLTWAETIVIPYNPQAAIFRYIIGKGWTPQSQEMSHDGAAYMWGWRPDNTRTLCGWINGQVQEVYTRPN